MYPETIDDWRREKRLERKKLFARDALECFKRLGICPYCKKENALPGVIYCAACREKKIEMGKEARLKAKEAGLCSRCGKREPCPGRLQCGFCIAKGREYGARFRKKARDAGLCPSCGKRPPPLGGNNAKNALQRAMTRAIDKKGKKETAMSEVDLSMEALA